MISMRSVRIFIIAMAAVAVGLSCISIAIAHEEKETGKESKKIPSTLDGVWHEVKEHQTELETVIKAKQLSKVHEIAFHIRDLVNTMPGKSAKLPAANLSKVKSNAKFLATLAARLDETGDANDQTGTEENYKKFADLLKSVESQYPSDVLKYKGEGEKKN